MKTSITLLTFALVAVCAFAQTDVLTERYDNSRTGANQNEAWLNVTTVASGNFGHLFNLPVDGQVYAQPLVMRIPGAPNSLDSYVYICTAHNSVYCYDSLNPNKLYWHVNFGPSVPNTDVGNTDIVPEIGIIGTPVIDKLRNELFVVAKTKENGAYFDRLHALNATTGAEMPGSPLTFQAIVPGTGDGTDGTDVSFDAFKQMNRPALLLEHGTVYALFGSHGDSRPYHGWVFAVSERAMRISSVYCNTADDGMGGLWMGGCGPAADNIGGIYFSSGNGAYSADGSGKMTGNSVVRLLATTTGRMFLSSFFTPYNSDWLNGNDLDLGSAGVVLLPGTDDVEAGGKTGTIFLLNSQNMGGFDSTGDQVVQEFNGGSWLFTTPICWTSADKGLLLYTWPAWDQGRIFQYSNGKFNTTAISHTSFATPYFPGGAMTLSSLGSQTGSAVLWVTLPYGADGHFSNSPGILMAFDGENLSHELWDSQMNAGRDAVGTYAKFAPPVVANGQVYVATFSGYVAVYGLNP